MARPRTPTALLELKGAFKKDPQRKRPNEPKEERPLGDHPGRLPADAIAFWNEIVKTVAPGVLKVTDRWAVEMAARLMEKFCRELSVAALLELGDMTVEEMEKLIKRETISSAELSTLRSLLAALGMTPADRSKLSIPVEKPKNEFSDLAEEATNFAARPN